MQNPSLKCKMHRSKKHKTWLQGPLSSSSSSSSPSSSSSSSFSVSAAVGVGIWVVFGGVGGGVAVGATFVGTRV